MTELAACVCMDDEDFDPDPRKRSRTCEGGPSQAATEESAAEDGDDEEVPAGHSDETCWMCMYQTDDEAKRLMEFIVRSVGYIDTFNIATQVSAFIYSRYKNVQDASGNVVELKGALPEDIERHIKKHILHPKVRIAVIIKELLQFQDHLHKNLVVEDAATGLSAVDKGNVELYLKVIAQITSLYKAETNSMLFGTEDT